jgi:RND superfamily putative drug exporter
LATINQFGSVVRAGHIGHVLDTFVVRTLTVPAIATLAGEAIWWPKHRV